MSLHTPLLALVLLAMTTTQVLAEGEYTAADTAAAIEQYAEEFALDPEHLRRVVWCESRNEPYAVGQAGELGAAQLYPRGELSRFYAYSYSDPFNPYEAIRFMAQRFAMGGATAWSCR